MISIWAPADSSQAAAGIQQQAYAQAAHLGRVHVEAAPGNVLVRQAHAVARIGQGQRLHHQRGIGHAARHGAGAAAGIGRVDGHAAQAGLEAEDAAPACGQADGAANVRAHMQRPVAGRRSGARACAGAARRLVRIPGVEGVAVQRGQARGQHAVVGHGGLGEEDGARLAQPRGGWCIQRGRDLRHGGRAHGRGVAARGDVVLDRGGDAVEQACRLAAQPAGLAGACLGQCGLGAQQVGGAQGRFPALHMGQQVVHDLDGREAALPVGAQQRMGG
jgi:hypothetical protein